MQDLAAVVQVHRERQVKGRTVCPTHYHITSLKGSARVMGHLIRRHWAIENEWHSEQDVTLGEDKCRVRKGTSPRVLASLRNLFVHISTQYVGMNEGRTRADAIR